MDDLCDVPAFMRFLSCEPLLGPMNRLNLDGVNWVIVGGESKTRPWPIGIASGWTPTTRPSSVERVALFKQWVGTRKHITGRELNGRTYDELPTAFARVP
jgi:protein gp37